MHFFSVRDVRVWVDDSRGASTTAYALGNGMFAGSLARVSSAVQQPRMLWVPRERIFGLAAVFTTGVPLLGHEARCFRAFWQPWATALWSIAHVELVGGGGSIEVTKRERPMHDVDSQFNEVSLGLGFLVMAITVMVVAFAYIDRIL